MHNPPHTTTSPPPRHTLHTTKAHLTYTHCLYQPETYMHADKCQWHADGLDPDSDPGTHLWSINGWTMFISLLGKDAVMPLPFCCLLTEVFR